MTTGRPHDMRRSAAADTKRGSPFRLVAPSIKRADFKYEPDGTLAGPGAQMLALRF
jgi:hypothetical protein